jgi:hypothetical protein
MARPGRRFPAASPGLGQAGLGPPVRRRLAPARQAGEAHDQRAAGDHRHDRPQHHPASTCAMPRQRSLAPVRIDHSYGQVRPK